MLLFAFVGEVLFSFRFGRAAGPAFAFFFGFREQGFGVHLAFEAFPLAFDAFLQFLLEFFGAFAVVFLELVLGFFDRARGGRLARFAAAASRQQPDDEGRRDTEVGGPQAQGAPIPGATSTCTSRGPSAAKAARSASASSARPPTVVAGTP